MRRSHENGFCSRSFFFFGVSTSNFLNLTSNLFELVLPIDKNVFDQKSSLIFKLRRDTIFKNRKLTAFSLFSMWLVLSNDSYVSIILIKTFK